MADGDKKYIVGGIQKFSLEDGPGIRTTVFTKGCPLDCKWCHNPELIQWQRQVLWNPNKCIGDGGCLEVCPADAIHRENEMICMDWDKCIRCLRCTEVCYAEAIKEVGKEMTIDEVMHTVMQDAGFYKNTGGGLTISGGEVLSNYEFTYALASRAKEEGLTVAIDTSGYGRYEDLLELAGMCDYILYDMKHIDDEKHLELTKVSNKTILESLTKLAEKPEINEKIIMRMPLIKGLNDDDDTIDRTVEFYEKNNLREVNLLAYHNLGVSKKHNIGQQEEEFEAPDDDRMQEIKQRFLDHDIHATIMGEKD